MSSSPQINLKDRSLRKTQRPRSPKAGAQVPAASLDLEISCRPVADGGEGTAKVICEALGGSWVSCTVRDPLGRPVAAKYALVNRGVAKTAVMDMSEASGLWRVAADERCVERQSTYGTGEMLAHALRSGKADRVVIGLGGSATNDGGMGLAAALGFRFLDGGGLELEPVPANLTRLEKVTPPSDLSWISGRVVAAVDVFNPLLGERGATRVYGPQKGLAGETEIRMLEAGLSRLAGVVANWREDDLRDRPGAGAAGGLGFGLMAFCGAEVHRGFDEVAELLVWLKRLPVPISSSPVKAAWTPRLSKAKRRWALPSSRAASANLVSRLPGGLTPPPGRSSSNTSTKSRRWPTVRFPLPRPFGVLRNCCVLARASLRRVGVPRCQDENGAVLFGAAIFLAAGVETLHN